MNPFPNDRNSSDEAEVDLTTERLAHLVHQKSILVRELHKLVSKQQTMIRNQEVDLIPLLAVKQRVLETLNEVDRAMDPFRQQDPDRRIWKSTEVRNACRDEADQCESLFRQVLLIENDCSMVLQQQQQKTREQLQGAVAAGQVSRAYQQNQTSGTSQHRLDLVSEG
ncbi:MAG: hypothetical protein JNL67_07310 [Planctomycetaceae bacterium]|nr:hypothetical protein [Planctomycetaceae bacterium]